MTETTQTGTSRGRERGALQNWALVLSSLVIPVPIFFSKIVEAILKSSNPADVNIGSGLAYLQEQLAWGFGSLGVLLVILIVIYVIIYRRARTLDALKVPLLILALQVVLGIAILLLGGIVSSAVDHYSA